MTAKSIFAIILAVVSFIGLVLALWGNEENSKNVVRGTFFGIMIWLLSMFFTGAIMCLLF